MTYRELFLPLALIAGIVLLSAAFVALALFAYKRGTPVIVSSTPSSSRGYEEHTDGDGDDDATAASTDGSSVVNVEMETIRYVTPTEVSPAPLPSSSDVTASPVAVTVSPVHVI